MDFSIGRRPIGPGCRIRKLKNLSTVDRILVSDEENTSEYSHAPSSHSSTLESNPDGQRAYHLIARRASTKIYNHHNSKNWSHNQDITL